MSLKFLTAAAFAMLPALVAAADTPSTDLHLDVPQDKGAQHVNVLTRVFPPGGTSGWHIHPGVEIATVISGEMELHQEGQPMRRMLPGDSFLMPRGQRHNGVNTGQQPARLLITYVTDTNVQVKIPADAP